VHPAVDVDRRGGRLRARWSTQRPLAVAALDGRKLRATMLAP
jgi:hypothetical protein